MVLTEAKPGSQPATLVSPSGLSSAGTGSLATKRPQHCRGSIPSPSSRSQSGNELWKGSVRAGHGKRSPWQEAMGTREGG